MTTNINKSLLNNNNFRLLIEKIPATEYFVKSATIPSLSFTELSVEGGIGISAFYPGDKAEFGTLDVTFLVDEDLQNYKEIYDWIDAIVPLADPTSYVRGSTTTSSTTNIFQSEDTLLQTSQITLITNTNKNIPNKFFRFYDAFPTSLGQITFESGADNETIAVDVSFRFTYYRIESSS